MSTQNYSGKTHQFTSNGAYDTILIKPGYTETLDLGGSINIIDLPNNSASLSINGIPVTSGGGSGGFSVLNVTSGGTGLSSINYGDMLYGSNTNVLSTLSTPNLNELQFLSYDTDLFIPQWFTNNILSAVCDPALEGLSGLLSIKVDSEGTTSAYYSYIQGQTNEILVTSGLGGQPILIGIDPVYTASLSPFNKNMLFNSDFQVSQRGTTFGISANNITYTLDRWQSGSKTSGPAITVQQIFNNGITNSSAIRVQRNSGNSAVGLIYLGQSLPRDACQDIASKTVNLSFQILVGSNFSGTGVTYHVQSGTDTSGDRSFLTGTYTGSSSVISATKSLTTSNTSYVSVSASASCGSSVSELCVYFTYTPVGTASTNDFFQITNVKLEVGNVATNFEHDSFNEELQLCQYYYCKSFAYSTAPSDNIGALSDAYCFAAMKSSTGSCQSPSYNFPCTMRSNPSITIYNPNGTGTTGQVYNVATTITCSATTIQEQNQSQFNINCNGTSGQTVGDPLYFAFSANAELT